MRTKHAITAVFFGTLIFGASAVAQQTTSFTYQGRLTDGSMPANGTYNFTFKLFYDQSGGTQISPEIQRTGVPVTNGIFTVELDFGQGNFASQNARYMEVAMSNGGPFVPLVPRQAITSAPYSIRSMNAGTADSLSAACVLCITSAQVSGVEGSRITGTVTNATVPGAIRWTVVPGTSQQAQSNNGYITNNAGQVTITLPVSPAVGDVVRVSGMGAGGWKIAQNAGQYVLGANLGMAGSNWTARDSNRSWYSIASSADGSKLAAVVYLFGQIYTSADFGATWTPRMTDATRDWQSIASSADGSKLAAVVNDGHIYTSTDFGATWTPRMTSTNRFWKSIASSADGSKLAAVVYGGPIYTSFNSGANWAVRMTDADRSWWSIASSADGSKLAAVVYGGQIYISANGGATWTARMTDAPRYWVSIASSADGSKLAALETSGHIYISANSGATWTPRMTDATRNWQSIASSGDGSKLAAVVYDGPIYTSVDSGASWTARMTGNWVSIASSADGFRLAAAVSSGRIYISSPDTTPGTAGYLTGSQGTAIELQYLGNGQFLPLSHEGTIVGF